MESEPERIYEPLIWFISSIEVCDIHKIILKEKCSVCNKYLPFLHSKYRAGYCQYCSSFLGQDMNYCKGILTKDDEFILFNYRELLSKTNGKSFPTKIALSIILKKIIKEAGFINMTDLARYIGYKPERVFNWIRDNHLPSFKVVIDIAQKLNLSIYELFYNNDIKLKYNINLQVDNPIRKKNLTISEIGYHLNKGLVSKEPKALYNLAREIGTSKITAQKHLPLLCAKYEENYLLYKKNLRLKQQREIESSLKECLAKERPISLNQCVKENGLSYTVVKKLAPDLSRKVSERYRNYIVKSGNDRKKLILSKIREIAIEMHNKGIFPSRERIEKELGSVVFPEKEIRDGWLEIIYELNYKVHKDE